MTVTVSSPDDIGFEQQMTLDISDWSFNPETESAMTAAVLDRIRRNIDNARSNY